MFRKAEVVIVVLALAITFALALSNPGSDTGRRERRDVENVQRAAERLDYATVADAWMQARLGANAALSSIVGGIDVRYLSTHQEGDSIILTFQSRGGACIDLVSRPASNTVESRHC
ncbi:MAG: hypothetical protein LC792_20540 [Actinobacteria bacterium]|nr:hypothetical protein [Actinomycetota bacterium]